MDFLPTDYEAPKSSSSYMKISDGENKIRILSSPIIGWEDWRDKKPIRYRMNNKPEKPIDASKPIRHFWSMIVWNYSISKLQILEITQATIRGRIEDLSKDSDWGSPYNYDIKIVKSGTKERTEYAVNPSPSREIDPMIKEEFYKVPIDLEELFRGGDPFSANAEYRTKAFWESKPKEAVPEEIVEEVISPYQSAEIQANIAKNISPVDPFWVDSFLKAFKVSKVEQIKKRHYEMASKRIEDKKMALLEDEIPF